MDTYTLGAAIAIAGTGGGGGGGDLPSGGSPGDVLEKTANGTKWSSDVTELKSAVQGKQAAPAAAGTAGQVLGLDNSLNPVWVNQSGGGGGVSDVKIDGTSVVSEGVANIPVADSSNPGVVKVSSSYGLAMASGGIISVYRATDSTVKGGTNNSLPLTAGIQHQSVFYGLSKAAGVDLKNETVTVGTYTDDAKTAIQKMLGAGNNWELINTAELTEDAASISISTDSNGQPFRISHYAFIMTAKGSTATTSNTNLYVKLNPYINCGNLQGIIRSSDTNVAATGQIIINATASGQVNFQTLIGPSVSYNSPINAYTLPSDLKTYADYFEVYVTGTARLGSGSVLRLFGIRC